MFYTARRSGLRGRKLVYIAATATHAAPTRVFGIFARYLRKHLATVIKSTYTLRQTYVYVLNRTPIIRLLYAILRVGTPISYVISTPYLCIRYATIR